MLGYAPKPPCFLQIDTDGQKHIKERPRHDSKPNNAREALLAIHETCVKHTQIRTATQLTQVEKNLVGECANRKYKPGDSVDFFKNTENPQRTCGVIKEQVMEKQYKVRYGANQHTNVATRNMLLVISQDTEVNPEDTNIGIEDIIEEDTGLTQQIRRVNPSPTPREVPGTGQQDTNPSPWLDEDEVHK